jgi:hypothetical protein
MRIFFRKLLLVGSSCILAVTASSSSSSSEHDENGVHRNLQDEQQQQQRELQTALCQPDSTGLELICTNFSTLQDAFGNQVSLLRTFICPLSAADDPTQAIRDGMCQCSTQATKDGESFGCQCDGCPVGSLFFTTLQCEKPFLERCVSIGCDGLCLQEESNGLLPLAEIEWQDVVPAAVSENTGVFLPPNEDMVIVVYSVGGVLALDPNDGTELWRYSPPSLATPISSMGGVAFARGSEYMVYSVLDDNTRYVRTTRPCT